MRETNKEILIIEDEELIAENISIILKRKGYKIHGIFDNSEDVFNHLENTTKLPDIVLNDIHIAGNTNGIECAKIVSEKYKIPILFLSSVTDEKELNEALSVGPAGYLLKPFNIVQADTMIQITLKHRQLEKELEEKRDNLEKLVNQRTKELSEKVQDLVRTKEELEESKLLFSGILKISSDAIISTEADGKIFLFNKGAEHIFGYKNSEVIGKPIDILLPKRYIESHKSLMKEFGKEIESVRGMGERSKEVFGLKKDGTEFYAEVSISKLELYGKLIFTATLRNISDRIRTEKQLKEKDEFITNVFNNMGDGIFVVDVKNDGRFVYTAWNKKGEEDTGILASEILGKTPEEVFPEELASRINKNLRICCSQKKIYEYEDKVITDTKKIYYSIKLSSITDNTGKVFRIVGIVQNITDRKNIEEQINRSQRIESLGRLAGGIAHDFNNILTPIMLGLDRFKRLFQDEKNLSRIDRMENSAMRGQKLVKQILTFARGEEGENRVIEIKERIHTLEQFLRSTIPKSITQKIVFKTHSLHQVYADPTHIDQILMNLCVNAIDAMPEGGLLNIEIDNFYVDVNYAKMRLGAQKGDYVMVTVSDTGTGITSENLNKIFDPFFSTKDVSKGTGLGLATVSSLVKNMKGFLEVDTQINVGTSFKLYFPAYTEEGEVEKTDNEEIHSKQAKKSGTILIIDDEENIREAIKDILEDYGYEVQSADGGAKGIVAYSQNMEKISVVIVDILMPVIDGIAVIQSLKEMNPNVKVIASSGYIDKERESRLVELQVAAIVKKPYKTDELLNTLNIVMGD